MLYVLLSIYCLSALHLAPRPTSNLSSRSRDLRGWKMESIGDRQHELMRNRRTRRKSQITLFNRTTTSVSPAPTLPTTQSYRSHHSAPLTKGERKKHTTLYPSGGAS